MIANQLLHGEQSTYKIESRLGSGGMAIVYRAVDQQSQSTVAIKQVYDWLADNTEGINRFRREVKVVTKLLHPSIVPIIDSGEHQSAPFMVMPFYQQGSLATVIRSKPVVTVGETLIRLHQVASALEYAHAKGIVHRDLKLENCLVNNEGGILLADFGMAHVVDATRLTFTGDLRGTPLIMAPEQGRGDKQIDKGVDIYALATIAYLLLTGYYPFTSHETLALINMHTSHRAPLPSEVNPNLPDNVDDVLLKSLSKISGDRHPTAMALIHDLDVVLADYAMLPVEIGMENDNPLPSIVETITFNQTSQSTVNTPIGKQKKVASTSDRRPIWMIMAVAIFVLISGGVVGSSGLLNPPIADQNDSQTIVLLPEESATPTITSTNMPTITSTSSATPTATATSSPMATETPTLTSSPTLTDTPTATNTSAATLTHTATATETSIPLPGLAGIVDGEQGANVRQGAHTTYRIVTHLDQNETMRLIGRNYRASWFEVLLDDEREGWVSARLVDYGDKDILDLPITWIEPTATPIPPTATPIPPIAGNHNFNFDGNNGNSNGGNNGDGGTGTDNSTGGGEDDDGGLLDDVEDAVNDLLP